MRAFLQLAARVTTGLTALLLPAVAVAHAVSVGDKGYIPEITGVHLLPFAYLGAKHMFTGYDHFYHGYGKARNSSGERGELVAAFDGTHGWYWRNRGTQTVTITLRTRGEYTAIKRVV